MRRLAPAVALALASALACGGSKDRGVGAGIGKACTAARDCGGALVCLTGKCVAEAPASASCTLPSHPTIALGAPMDATEPPPGTCETPVRAPVYAGAQHLGPLQVGQEEQFQVPEGTWSVTIVSQEVAGSAADFISFQVGQACSATSDCDPGLECTGGQCTVAIPNSVVPLSVRAPDDRVFYDDFATVPRDDYGYPDFTHLLTYYGGFTPVSGALTLPNASPGLDVVRSAGGLPAGTWSLTVNDYAYECLDPDLGCSGGSSAGLYDVQVLTRPGPMASTGTLDLDIYVASTTETAAALARDPRLSRLVESAAAVLGNAGICLGSVVLHDLPQWARDKHAFVNLDSTGPCDELSQLFTLAVAQRPSVHVFLVDGLTVSSSDPNDPFVIAGIDGSIPGPSGVPGTVNGGAVATFENFGAETRPGDCAGSLDPARCGTDHLAYVVAHEAAHWLGLYHTTEKSGTLFDPLTDTPTCACAACAPPGDRALCDDPDAPTTMTGDSCAQDAATCSGASNLMFWLLDEARSKGSVTPQQAEVMRLNPAVR